MIRALLALVAGLRSAWFVELAGAAAVVAGVWVLWGYAAGLIAVGVALLLKAFELDQVEP